MQLPPHIVKIIKTACRCRENWECHGCQWLKEQEMPKQQFELIAKWLPYLSVCHEHYGRSEPYVNAGELEAELAKASHVCAHQSKATDFTNSPVWISKPWQDANSTHEALMIGARPIKHETAEDLLRELIGSLGELKPEKRAIEKAIAFLEKKKP